MLDIGGGMVARPVRSGGAWEAVVERPARHPRGRAIRLPVLIGDRVTKTHAVRGAMTSLLKRTPTPEELAERPGGNEETPSRPLGAPELCNLERPVYRSTRRARFPAASKAPVRQCPEAPRCFRTFDKPEV